MDVDGSLHVFNLTRRSLASSKAKLGYAFFRSRKLLKSFGSFGMYFLTDALRIPLMNEAGIRASYPGS